MYCGALVGDYYHFARYTTLRLAHSCNRCCHGKATILSLFIVSVGVAVNSIKVFSVVIQNAAVVDIQNISYCC
jgi:hypothetical protein